MKYTESLRINGQGYITVIASDEFITELNFVKAKNRPNELTTKAIKQLNEYLLGERKVFSLPLKAHGSEFQQKVWSALSKIEFGKYLTYKDIAQTVGGSNYARAVGMACNKNPLAIFIPCHRVLGSKKTLTGYAGGVSLKKELLMLEKIETV